MSLFKPFWRKKLDTKTNNYEKIQKGKEKITAISDQMLLKQIAMESPVSEFRNAAVSGLMNQEDLLQVYTKEQTEYIRESIASKLCEGDALYRIAKTDPAAKVRLAAASRITNEKVLAEIAGTDKSVTVRACVIKSGRIKDNKLLFDLAKKAENTRYDMGLQRGTRIYFEPGVELLSKITDQNLAMQAVQGQFAGIKASGILYKLSMSQLLTLAADRKLDWYLHLRILEIITRGKDIDETALADVLSAEQDYDYRQEECIKVMNRADDLERIIRSAFLDSLKDCAVKRLSSIDAKRAASIACAMLSSAANDTATLKLLWVARREYPEKAIAVYSELTSEEHDLTVRWEAALALTKMNSASAVEPLITLLLDYRENPHDCIGDFIIEHLIRNATQFLKNLYRHTTDAEIKAAISRLPGGVYYTHSAGLCEHSDVKIHFDLDAP